MVLKPGIRYIQLYQVDNARLMSTLRSSKDIEIFGVFKTLAGRGGWLAGDELALLALVVIAVTRHGLMITPISEERSCNFCKR